MGADKESLEERARLLRREQIAKLLSLGQTQLGISKALNIPLTTVHRDAELITQRAKDKLNTYGDTILPEQHDRCLTLLDQIIGDAYKLYGGAKYERNAINSLHLVLECILAKADLIANVSLIGRTVQYIESLRKRNNELAKEKVGDSEAIDGKVEPYREKPINHVAGQPLQTEDRARGSDRDATTTSTTEREDSEEDSQEITVSEDGAGSQQEGANEEEAAEQEGGGI